MLGQFMKLTIRTSHICGQELGKNRYIISADDIVELNVNWHQIGIHGGRKKGARGIRHGLHGIKKRSTIYTYIVP